MRANFRYLEALLFCVIAGCATEKIKVTPLPPGSDPSEGISELQRGVDQSRTHQLDLLAPQNYTDSLAALRDAKIRRADGASDAAILAKVAEGEAYLAQAYKKAELSQTVLKDAVAARKDAVAAQAPRSFRDAFIQADGHFFELAHRIEGGRNGVSQKDVSELTLEYRGLEQKGLRETYLGPPSRLIKQSKDEGADQYAPKTLADTEKRAAVLDADIRQGAGRTELERVSEDLNRQAKFLLVVTRESKGVQAHDPEDTVLRMERLKQEVAELGAEASRIGPLEREVRFDERFKRIKALFTPDEAEVGRTDTSVTIRLKGLSFAAAESQISAEDYDLLAKAAKAIALFGGDSRVIVEGHTDSMGSEAANTELSLERAKAVKEFLVAGGSGGAGDRVRAEGKGFSAPIASDKTSQGRALNRRVDILIESAQG